jgi:hypothetical protein
MEDWLNAFDEGNPKYSEENLTQRHFVHPKSHMHRTEIEAGPPQ